MAKKWIVFGLVLALAGFLAFSAGCGQAQSSSTATTTTTTTTLAAASSVGIKGSTSSTATGMGVGAFAAVGTAEVYIGYCTKDSDAITNLVQGTTDAIGDYALYIATASLEALKASGGYVPNLMVIVSKEGVVYGCVIPSISPEAGFTNYAPSANPGDYKKQLVTRSSFKKGMDPRNFDYTGNIDKKFSSSVLKDMDPSKMDWLADSIKSADDFEANIAEGLGIDAALLSQMKQKGFQLHKTYIEPIMQAAFNDKTPPNREQLDAAFARLEAAMLDYAASIGLTGQQMADLKSMKDKQMETKMGEEGFAGGDPIFQEAKLRMMGDKMTSMFLGQWDAANTIANLKPSSSTRETFASAYAARYAAFVASKEAIKTQLTTYLSSSTSPETMPNYLRDSFFDEFVNPPMSEKPPEGGSQASMEAYMDQFTTSRIMVYFMKTFLTESGRQSFFNTLQPSMEAVFSKRFNDTSNSSGYYMGPLFWETRPDAATVQTRVENFNTALTNAVEGNSALATVLSNAGFDTTQASAILKAFRIIMAPPDGF